MTKVVEIAAPAPTCSSQHAAPHACNPASGAQGRARQVQHNIVDGGNDPPQFARVGQNIVAAAMLLCGIPEPIDPQEWAVHRNIRALVETAAVQLEESSMS